MESARLIELQSLIAMKNGKLISVFTIVAVVLIGGWLAYRSYRRTAVIAAYNIPISKTPYPELSIPPVESRYRRIVGEISGLGTMQGGAVNGAAVVLLGDDYIKNAVLPSLRLERFYLDVNPREGGTAQRFEFCGAKPETGIVDASSVSGLNFKFVQLVYADARLNGANCSILIRLDDLTPQLQFKGFTGALLS